MVLPELSALTEVATYERRTTVRYFERMNPGRAFPRPFASQPPGRPPPRRPGSEAHRKRVVYSNPGRAPRCQHQRLVGRQGRDPKLRAERPGTG